jgi:transcriptional regulator with XRE-family HTH domain
MSPDESAKKNPQGPVGAHVVANLVQLRGERKLTYRELSDRLAQLGRPIPTLGLSRIEKGERRVDADDLVALAIALGVTPNALLLPRDVDAITEVALTPTKSVLAGAAWNWADGRNFMHGPQHGSWRDQLDFVTQSRPRWQQAEYALQRMEEIAAAAAREEASGTDGSG